MKSNSSLRAEALRHLDGKWGTFVLITFLYTFIAFVCGLPSQVSSTLQQAQIESSANPALTTIGFLLTLALIPMSWSFSVMFLKNHRDERCDIPDLFAGYKQFGRVFGTVVLAGIYTLLWSLLFIIPGIIKSFSYALTNFILKDKPELSFNSAIELSMKMMEGNKMRLFLLYLSFIGWSILALLTCGIGFLWLIPYMNASMAAFYEDVRADYASATEGYAAE